MTLAAQFIVRARRSGRAALGRLVAVLLLFVAAPTVGDIGSCTEAEDDLDAAKFFQTKAAIDCLRCGDCGLSTALCKKACSPQAPPGFPTGCAPLVHDGEVCLNALERASCGSYEGFMNPAAPTVPTECDFCPVAR